MARAEVLKAQLYEKTYESILKMMETAVSNGEHKAAVSYKFFHEDNGLLKYVIDKAVEDGFILRLYEDRMEVHLS